MTEVLIVSRGFPRQRESWRVVVDFDGIPAIIVTGVLCRSGQVMRMATATVHISTDLHLTQLKVGPDGLADLIPPRPADYAGRAA